MTRGIHGRCRRTAAVSICPWMWALPLLACAALTAVWWRIADRDTAPTGIVIVTLDTIRVDRLSAYGFMNGSQPHLDRLARDGVIFEQAFSVAPLTLPAHSSLFTGLFPPAHRVRDNAGPPLQPVNQTLAELLRARGFRTGAFVGSIVLGEDRGLAQGFEHYSVPVEAAPDGGTRPAFQRRADAVVNDAIDWLDGVAGSPFFLWAHLYDPHRPYDPPEPYRSRYSDPYLGEIAFADEQIGRLLDAIRQRRLLPRTLVVVAGDHGESLGDHGERDHGIFVYENVLRVPLIISGPAVVPARLSAVVRLVDVMPTVLNLAGLPDPRADGVSLVGMMKGGRDLDLDVYAESFYPQRLGWAALRTLRRGRFKLIDAPRPELYDLVRDPFEKRNIYGDEPSVAAALTKRLTQVAGSRAVRLDASEVDPELRERVSALGYVGATRVPAGREQWPDPKDCIATLNLNGAARTASRGCGR